MSDTQSSDLVGQRNLRIEKLNKLRSMGIDTFPAVSKKEQSNNEVHSNFEKYNGKTLSLAGRIKTIREHGKLKFMDLEDMSGRIQVYIKSDVIEEDLKSGYLGFENLSLLDASDFIEVTGEITKTDRGEVSILAKHVRLLTKSIRPMPTSLEDKEDRFRRRYLDMNLHPEVRERFVRRAKFWTAVRDFYIQNGFIEVNIPVLEHTTGGADAKPFVTHYDALDEDFYLRISHELPLKRLIGAGFNKVFDLGPRFRNEGFSDEHLPEHIAMEWYWAYADYNDGMKLTEDMFKYVMKETYGTTKFNMRGFEVDLEKEWERLDYATLLKDKFNVDIYNDDVDMMNDILKKNGVDLGKEYNRSRVVDNLWKLIRKTLAGPAFLINEPKFMSPLAKTDPNNENVTQRFHAIVAGSELVNAYSELNDPIDQLNRFLEQEKLRGSGDDEAQMLDIDFVEMLEYGMPPTCGWGMSERVFWFFEGVSAKEGVPFPQLKFDLDPTTKEIYTEVNFDEMMSEKKSNSSEKEMIFEYENVENLPSIADANALIEKYVTDDYHKLHAKMVATGLRAYAKKFGANQKLWYLTGLLHDLDYTQLPDEHPFTELKWFKEWGYPEELIHAVAAHDHVNTGEQPKTPLAKAIIAVDEMAGLIYAYSVMKDGGFKNLETNSVVKKFNDKKFAAKIDREEILFGMNKLGLKLEDHIGFLINAFAEMKDVADADFENKNIEQEISKEQDFNNKIAIVVNGELESWQVLNTVAHVSAYLGHKLDEKFGTGENFITKDGKNHPRNSQYAIVVLKAKPGQMANFMNSVRDSKLMYHGFIKEMIETTDDSKITEILSNKSDSEIEYLGVGVFGDNEVLKKLTNKFSLWK